jgi:hypothetical protein
MYLRKVGPDYFVYVLGRNGEPQVKADVSITSHHKDFSDSHSTYLKTDKLGKVGLGNLKDITSISANIKNGGKDINETWTILNQNKDSWTSATDFHIIEGESIELPVNFDDSKKLSPSEVSLGHYRNSNIIQNLFNRIELTKASCGHYHILKLEGLEEGEYKLETKFCSNEYRRINITVHKGTYW